MSPLQWARHLHEQAVRNLRRLDAEARRQRSATLDNAREHYRERVARTLANLRAIEATQPTGAEHPAQNPTSTQLDSKGHDHASRI